MRSDKLALAGLLLLTSVACVDNHASIEIFGICSPDDDAEACEPPPGECDRYVAARPWMTTTVDVGRPFDPVLGSLELFMQLNNQLPNNANEELGRVNTNDFIVEYFVLEFTSSTGLAIPPIPEYPTLAPPVPASGTTSAWLPIIPWEIAAYLEAAMPADSSAIVTTSVRVVGHLLDGSTIETGAFEIPVDVYNATYTGAICPAGEVVLAYCPGPGQTGSVACGTP